MKVFIELTLSVDEEANFLNCNPEDHLEDILEKICDAIYDIDDIELEKIEGRIEDEFL